jgi:hypothetical protein
MSRRGVALLLAIGFLAILGALTASAFALAATERRAGSAAVSTVQAQASAEGALAMAMTGWPKDLLPLAVGDERPLTTYRGAGGTEGQARLRSLGGPVFSLRAVGLGRSFSGIERASAGFELLVRLDSTGADTLIRPRAIARAWSRIFP